MEKSKEELEEVVSMLANETVAIKKVKEMLPPLVQILCTAAIVDTKLLI